MKLLLFCLVSISGVAAQAATRNVVYCQDDHQPCVSLICADFGWGSECRPQADAENYQNGAADEMEFSSQNRGRFCPVGKVKTQCRTIVGPRPRYVTRCLALGEKCPR